LVVAQPLPAFPSKRGRRGDVGDEASMLVGRQTVIFLVIDQPVPDRDRQIGITRLAIGADRETSFVRYLFILKSHGSTEP